MTRFAAAIRALEQEAEYLERLADAYRQGARWLAEREQTDAAAAPEVGPGSTPGSDRIASDSVDSEGSTPSAASPDLPSKWTGAKPVEMDIPDYLRREVNNA